MMNKFVEKRRKIIEARFEGCSFSGIGRDSNLSKQRVHQVIQDLIKMGDEFPESWQRTAEYFGTSPEIARLVYQREKKRRGI